MSDDKDNNLTLGDVLGKLLSPRSKLDNVPGFVPAGEAPAAGTGRIRRKDVLGNFPLMLGIILVLGLLAVVVFGPVIAPQNPYIAGQHIVPHFDHEKDEFIRPPLEPSEEFIFGTDQWGTDIFSMLLHGARNTLIASAFITMVRIILGLTLGAIAGWNEGQTSDRLIMGLIGMITALPLLISTMILIYALDIRRGLIVFIIAMSIMGWTEIAQYIRSEFLVLRKMPYIEGATATGLTGLQTAVRHILPNVLPQLLVITFLEMGAVLLLLGELAFVGVYIGGGSRIDLTEPLGPTIIQTIAEIPEWGAMLADGFRWLRSKPFVVMPPAFAFFIAVLGFNMLGEGLRRLIEKQTMSTAFLLKKRMLVVIALMTLAVVFIMNNTGAAPWFAKVAQSFSGEQVYVTVEELVAMDGRGNGQTGGEATAVAIADKFAEYGLEPAWKPSTYFYPLETRLVQPITQPELALMGDGATAVSDYRHQLDFGFVIDGHGGNGDVTAPLTFVGFERRDLSWADYVGLDLQGRIVLLQEGDAPPDFPTEALIRGALGIIWISGDGRDAIRSQIQLAEEDGDYLRNPNIPIFRVRPNVAEEWLAIDGLDLMTALQVIGASLYSKKGWYTRDLDSTIHMKVELSAPQETEVPSVMGYIPGTDLDLADELVVVYVTYDGLGIDPDGTVYPAANHNAAGVSLMLEVLRLWQEQEVDVRRTTMFVAWGGSQLDESGVRQWLNDPFNFRHLRSQSIRANISPAILLQLDYVGAGGDTLLIHPNSDDNLQELFAKTSAEFDIPLETHADTPEFTSDGLNRSVRTWASIKWEGEDVPPTEDTLDRIDQTKLQKLGQMLTLTLTTVVRETRY